MAIWGCGIADYDEWAQSSDFEGGGYRQAWWVSIAIGRSAGPAAGRVTYIREIALHCMRNDASMSQAASDVSIESDHEFFELTGPLPTAWDEHRRFPRFYFRSCAEMIIHPLRGERNADAPARFVLTRDLSRGGMSLIHTEQLFPTQRLEIILNGEPKNLEVVWCRRWTDGRYVVGCRFVFDSKRSEASDAAAADSAEAAESTLR
jgi:hypothetical protein